MVAVVNVGDDDRDNNKDAHIHHHLIHFKTIQQQEKESIQLHNAEKMILTIITITNNLVRHHVDIN